MRKLLSVMLGLTLLAGSSGSAFAAGPKRAKAKHAKVKHKKQKHQAPK